MPSLGCVQGFVPQFDLDTTEHDLRNEPSMSQELLVYLSRGGSQVSDRAACPVIRPTAAAEPRCALTGPDAYFHRIQHHIPSNDIQQLEQRDGVPLEHISKYVSVMVPWEMSAHLCRDVDFFFRRECDTACVQGLGTTWRISPNSSPLGANIILGLTFPADTLAMVMDQIAIAVREHIHRSSAAVIHSSDFPLRHSQLLHCKNDFSQRMNLSSDFQVYNDEILLKSSL